MFLPRRQTCFMRMVKLLHLLSSSASTCASKLYLAVPAGLRHKTRWRRRSSDVFVPEAGDFDFLPAQRLLSDCEPVPQLGSIATGEHNSGNSNGA